MEKADNEVLCLVANMRAKEGKADFIREEMEKLVAPTRAEKGCILYVLHQGNKEPNLFILYEKWETYEDWQAHRVTAHMQNFAKVTEGALAERGVIELTKIK